MAEDVRTASRPDRVSARRSSTPTVTTRRDHAQAQITAGQRPNPHSGTPQDGTLIRTDRSRAVGPTAGVDLWWSGKHHAHGANIQVLTAPDGWPLWTSPVRPGREHDTTCARTHHGLLPTPSWRRSTSNWGTATPQLASVNDELREAIGDLDRRNRMHEVFTNVAATGGSAPEIAVALHELTGLVVVVEDRFGNLLGWAGGQEPKPRQRSPRDRTELLNRIRRGGSPMRERDRILALAQPRDEVLGVLALVDPQRRAGRFELFALEYAAMVLAVDLAHQRSLAETELRLRGDLVDDLLTGADEPSALARSTALGHDLRPPHQILVVSWPGIDDLERVARAVTRLTQARALLTRRGGNVVVVVPARDADGQAHLWSELHRLLSSTLPSTGGAIAWVGSARVRRTCRARTHRRCGRSASASPRRARAG